MPLADEIDAIGKARSAQADSGSQEREQGLLQLLYEMDGMKIDDKVAPFLLPPTDVCAQRRMLNVITGVRDAAIHSASGPGVL